MVWLEYYWDTKGSGMAPLGQQLTNSHTHKILIGVIHQPSVVNRSSIRMDAIKRELSPIPSDSHDQTTATLLSVVNK